MNNIIIVGNLCKDIEVKTSSSGKPYLKNTVAVQRDFKAPNEDKYQSDFFNITVFGKTAEFMAKFCAKGKKVLVQGRMQSGDYEKDGIKHYTMDLMAEKVEPMEWAKKGESTQSESGGFTPVDVDESALPF